MGKLFRDTPINLLIGLRLALFRPCSLDQFVINTDQWAVLLVLDLLLNLGLGYLAVWPEPSFNLDALPSYTFEQATFFLLVYVLARAWQKQGLFLAVVVISLSLSSLLNGLIYLDRYWQVHIEEVDITYQIWGVVVAVYSLAVLGRGIYIASGRLKGFTAVCLAAVIGVGTLQFYYFGDARQFWYVADDSTDGNDRWAEYRAMDAEQLLYRQPDLLADTLQSIKPQQQAVTELFFVGFAPYATEDVFYKEVTFAKGVMDQRFDTVGHSLNLINHLDTRETLPLATATNLGVVLKHIGKVMDTREDVLVLYLTSHGSEDHELSVNFWPLPFNDITPEKLRTLLDEAGIKWRVIIVSACYSGGFINALANDDTLVATAAAADKTSFGCGTQSEFTYFGEALFKGQLPQNYSLVSALEQARIEIAKREQREGIEASLPQLAVGKAIKEKLADVAKAIPLRHCQTQGQGGAC
jgi:hypothetical protein